VNDNLSAKYFVGLAVDQHAPDHSTLTVFRDRLQQNGKLAQFNQMLEEIIRIALEKGIQFGSFQVVDSVHCVADVNISKDEGRQKRGQEPHEPDARWGTKHTYKVKTEDGRVVKRKNTFTVTKRMSV
jgi:hypothetical protein